MRGEKERRKGSKGRVGKFRPFVKFLDSITTSPTLISVTV